LRLVATASEIMPPGSGLSTNEIYSIRRWIQEIRPAVTTTRPPTTVPETTTTQYMGPVVSWRNQVRPLLSERCGRCHGVVSSYGAITRDGVWVYPGQPDYSLVYLSSTPNAGMPPA